MDTEQIKRQAYLEQLRRVLPASPEWESWLQQSGELPPDFDALPSRARLPDLLINDEGQPITSAQAWQAQRESIRTRLRQWFTGACPPAPDRIETEVLGEQTGNAALAREVRLRFGPELRASLRLTLFIPTTAAAPAPVFLTQASHRDWATIALRRGYVACVYAGADFFDDTDTFTTAYHGYDWSRLMRRAWAASRCIDFLARVPQADLQHIAITGHSRNGKQSMMATAFDDRINLMISSSSGAGGVLSARDFSEQHFGEGIELITRRFPDWFHPRLRFFTGREDKLPVDLSDMVALAAPRPCLLSIALNDAVESSWAMQQTYRAVQRVYDLFGARDRLRILWRPGSHEIHTTIIERYLDWCDTQFGRATYEFPERLIHPWDWPAWQAHSHPHASSVDSAARLGPKDMPSWQQCRGEIRARVHALLGDAPGRPPALSLPLGGYGAEPPHIAELLGRPTAGDGLEKRPLVFGEYLGGDVYVSTGAPASSRRLPAILWLHPWSPSNGYVAMYRRGELPHLLLARAGYAVFCFDQLGFGRRIEEVEGFYARHPDWSLLGKMVADAQAALTALSQLPYIDPARILGVGYGLGSLVGLHLGALDDRLAGFTSVCGPAAFRLDTDEARTGGIRRWSHDTLLLPQLGNFIGQEQRIPYGIDDLMACFAPRPLLVVSPQLDRDAPPDLVTPDVESARRMYGLYGAADRLTQMIPEDYNRCGPEMLARVIEWLGTLG